MSRVYSYHHGRQLAKRPDFSPDRPLSAQQLDELRQRFSRMSMTGLYDAYHAAWTRCKMERDGKPPKAEFIQTLVQVWRELRKTV